MTDIANLAVEDMITKVSALPEISKDKVLYVYRQEILFAQTRSIQYPAVGILYGGMFPIGPEAQGRKQTLVVDVVLLMGEECNTSVGNTDEKPTATGLLDKIRTEILTQCTLSPSGHKWRLNFELPAFLTSTLGVEKPLTRQEWLMYVQRWSTVVAVGV